MRVNIRGRVALVLCLLGTSLVLAGQAIAQQVTLGNATATFCQTGFPVTAAIDGDFSAGNGWAVFGGGNQAQTAVFQNATDVGGGSETNLTFRLYQYFGSHSLGKFRISATTSNRSTYAQLPACDNASAAGTAVWTVLNPQSVSSANGATLTVQPDGSVLASGTLPSTDVVTFNATTSLQGITGFRLEALTDASLPFNGPGRFPDNGNFVLTELVVSVLGPAGVPTLGAWAMALMALLLAGAGVVQLRRKQVARNS